MEATKDAITIDVRPFIWPITSLIITLMVCITLIICANILAGSNSGSGSAVRGAAVANAGTLPAPTVDATGTTVVTTTVGEGALLGDEQTATVALIEFSDYECPFCQRFWTDTLGQIKDKYVNTGQVLFAYRDLPLSFHEPMASYAANLVRCAGQAGGDQAFYAMHDAWFQNSPSGGTGLQDSELTTIINGIGLNADNIIQCAKAGTFTEAIQADAAEAGRIGISGTPGFVVGVINADGTVTGEIISGAYPFDEFDRVISKYL